MNMDSKTCRPNPARISLVFSKGNSFSNESVVIIRDFAAEEDPQLLEIVKLTAHQSLDNMYVTPAA